VIKRIISIGLIVLALLWLYNSGSLAGGNFLAGSSGGGGGTGGGGAF